MEYAISYICLFYVAVVETEKLQTFSEFMWVYANQKNIFAYK